MKPLEVDVRVALDRFDLDVEFATTCPVTGVFGASGAGKTSLLETIAGVRRDARGRIALDGEAWLDSELRTWLPPEARGIGYVPQDALLFPHQSVRENLLAGARRAAEYGASPEANLEKVADLLELQPLLERSVLALSGGERRRVALGRALCSGPQLLLLDEPLTSLDLPLRRRLLPLLRRVRSELTVPMLLVSHDPIEVQALCDEIVVLREGRIIGRGEPSAVLTDPDVVPIAEVEGFVNVLPATLISRTPQGALVRLGEGGAELVTLPVVADESEEVLVGLASNQILIATTPPTGLSARNSLPATVREIRAMGPLALVRAELDDGGPALTVEVTASTPESLNLEPGKRVFLVVKATSCRLYSGGIGPSPAQIKSTDTSR